MIVDSNIFIHVFNPEDSASEQVRKSFETLSLEVQPCVNPVIFAELSPGFESAPVLEGILAAFNVRYVELSSADAFRAGQAFQFYRRKGGPRTSLIPDFLIGAQAAVRGWPIMTRDPKRFTSYFPEVQLIDPLAL